MIRLNRNIIRENCGKCEKQIYLGQSALVCSKCNIIFHATCLSDGVVFRQNIYCNVCVDKYDIIRYNPYYLINESDHERFYESEISDYNDEFNDLSNLLENCQQYSTENLNSILGDIDRLAQHESLDSFSSYFCNLDGNNSNFEKFSCEIASIKHEFSVIGIAETNVSACTKDLYQIGKYSSCYQNKKEGKKKGSGVGLYVHNKFSYTELPNVSCRSDNLESMFVKITNTAEPVIVGVVYRPPSGDYDLFLCEFESLLASFPSDIKAHILGDYNVDLLNPENTETIDFENVIVTSGFTPVISTHTHRREGCRKSCIDNILTNEPTNVIISGTISNDSDHKPVFQVSYLTKSTNLNNDKLKTKIFYNYSNENIDKFCSSLRRNVGCLDRIEDFDSFIEFYENAIDSTCKLSVPKCSKRTSLVNPWITVGIISSITAKNELYKSWIGSKTQRLPDGDHDKYRKFKEHRKVLKKTIKLAKKLHYSEKFEKFKTDPKKTWAVINELRGKAKSQPRSSFVIDAERITCRRAIANKFNEYFVTLASHLNAGMDGLNGLPVLDLPNFQSYLANKEQSSIYLSETNEDEIIEIIKGFENGKASDIPVILIKRSAYIISSVLTKLYNKNIESGIFPENFKIGKVTPVYKKDNPELLENYRPVSTLPIFGKIFEKIIYSRLYSFLTAKGILNTNQFGFRKGRATIHALHSSVNIVQNALKDGKHVLGIFIDLSKAFDTLDHKILLDKLEHYGIRGNAKRLFESYLIGRRQYTAFNNICADRLQVLFGVPQGSVLGPLLFLIYINDLKNCYNEIGCNFILYADDTNIFVVGSSKDDAFRKANFMLKEVYNYMKCNLLHINMKKCCYMHFEPSSDTSGVCSRSLPFVGNSDESKAIYINNVMIKEVSEVKFLGIILDNQLNWLPHVKYLVNKLRSAASALCRIRHWIPKDKYLTVYHALFESHLTYGITVWGGVSKVWMDQVFKIQKHCVRVLFGDLEMYLDKSRTCARVRPYNGRDSQKLGKEYYCKEHTKKLFNHHNILAVRNLHMYNCCMEIFKVMKFRNPINLFETLNISQRNTSMLLITPPPSSQFSYLGPKTWNSAFKRVLAKSEYDLTIKVSFVKNLIKKLLLKIQKEDNENEWLPANYTL